MKTASLSDYLLWKGKLAKIIWTAQEPSVGIEMIEESKCPHCNGCLGKKQFSVIPTSPLFQESAESIQTILTK